MNQPVTPGSQTGDDPLPAERLQNRLSGRLSLDFNFGIADFKQQRNSGEPFPLFRAFFGYRRNFAPEMGYHVRIGPMLGIPWRRETGDTGPDGVTYESTILTGGSLDGLFVFGPYGRFFVGPAVCVQYVYFTKNTWDVLDPTIKFHDGITAGGGFDLGGAFGSREQVSLYHSLRITAGAGESMIFMLFGVSFQR